jgi:hypothetical protein
VLAGPLQDRELVPDGVQVAEEVPAVGVAGDERDQASLAAAPDQDRRTFPLQGARLVQRALDAAVAAGEARLALAEPWPGRSGALPPSGRGARGSAGRGSRTPRAPARTSRRRCRARRDRRRCGRR